MRIAFFDDCASWLLCAFLFLGAYVFLQPAFEGFDENPHYSRTLDASSDMHTQFSGKRNFRSDVLNYPGPEAYASGDFPFSTDKTYDRFYLLSPESMAQIKQYQLDAHNNGLAVRDNWQYQHPPLYYILAGAFNRVFHFETMVVNLVALRMFSVMLSVLALILSCKGLSLLQDKLGMESSTINKALGMFVLCFPMFYFEFARLGNDALVFFCLSASFYFSVRAYKFPRPQSSLLCMATGLMLGLWTKAIVLPLLPVFAIFTLYCLWQSEIGKRRFWIVRDFVWTYVLPVASGLGWYVFSYLKFNDIGLGSEARDLGQTTGLVQGLIANFDFSNFVRGLAVPLVTFIYAGSWSLIRAPLGLYVLMSLIYGILAVRYALNLLKSPRSLIAWMPLGLFLFLYAGLAYHVLVSMALSGLGTSGGWYLYVLTPWLLLALCLGLDKMPGLFVKSCQWIGLGISVCVFTVNMLIYAGFVSKDNLKGMRFIGELWPDMTNGLLHRLGYVSYPEVAICLFVTATILTMINLSKKRIGKPDVHCD